MSKGGDMFCFGCNLPVRREEDLPPNFTSNKPAAAAAAAAVHEPVNKSQVSNAHATSNPPATGNVAVQANNESLDNDSGSKKETKDGELSDLEDIPPLAERELMGDEDEDFEFDAEAFARARKKSDEVSEKIGKHMLMGWTLMDIHCSTDFCPLMRSVDRKSMLCLSCGTEYEEEGEEDLVKITVAPSVLSKEIPLNASSSSSCPSSAKSSSLAPTSTPTTSSSSSSTSSSSTTTRVPPSCVPLLAPGEVKSSPPLDSALREEMREMEQALATKLAWARGILLKTQDFDECQRLAHTIRALLLAVNALHP
jgi:uncharacterized Zn finger protein (UPF0148 family)